MSEQNGLFSRKHNQLLNYATGAKYLAWITFTYFILTAISEYIRFFNSFGDPFFSNKDLLSMDPGMALKLLIYPLGSLLRGAIYFLVLKGISLGLNMIVETDINYREKITTGANNE